MAEVDVNSSDEESDSESSLELEIGSDGTIRPLMFEPQHGTSSEEEVDGSDTAQDQPETVESDVRSRFSNRDLGPTYMVSGTRDNPLPELPWPRGNI